jgi:hypothetical protein
MPRFSAFHPVRDSACAIDPHEARNTSFVRFEVAAGRRTVTRSPSSLRAPRPWRSRMVSPRDSRRAPAYVGPPIGFADGGRGRAQAAAPHPAQLATTRHVFLVLVEDRSQDPPQISRRPDAPWRLRKARRLLSAPLLVRDRGSAVRSLPVRLRRHHGARGDRESASERTTRPHLTPSARAQGAPGRRSEARWLQLGTTGAAAGGDTN